MTSLHSSVTTHILFLLVKKSACNAGDLGSICGLGRSPGEGNGHPLRYPCLAGYSPWGHKSRTQPERPTLLWKRAQCYLFKYLSPSSIPIVPFFLSHSPCLPRLLPQGLSVYSEPWTPTSAPGWASYLQILLPDLNHHDLHGAWGKSVSLAVAQFLHSSSRVRSTALKIQWFPWLISLFCSPDLGHKVHSHAGRQQWGSHLGASSRLFLQKSKVRAGKGSDFLWNNPDLLTLDPYCLHVPQKGQGVRAAVRWQKKTFRAGLPRFLLEQAWGP